MRDTGKRRLGLFVAGILLSLPAAALADGGKVTKILRADPFAFDANGQPLGQIKSSDIRLPAPIVGMGKGNSVGINAGGKVVYLRGLDVQTEGLKTTCAKVQTAARAGGSAYAATNLGLGGAADCSGDPR